jgi:hypothetical protein
MLTTFFVIDGKGTYSLLLSHDWIHANCCIPSTTHQCVIQWIRDAIEVVQADTSTNVALAEPSGWNFEGIECFSGKTWNEGIIVSAMMVNSRYKQSARRVYFNGFSN